MQVGMVLVFGHAMEIVNLMILKNNWENIKRF